MVVCNQVRIYIIHLRKTISITSISIEAAMIKPNIVTKHHRWNPIVNELLKFILPNCYYCHCLLVDYYHYYYFQVYFCYTNIETNFVDSLFEVFKSS